MSEQLRRVLREKMEAAEPSLQLLSEQESSKDAIPSTLATWKGYFQTNAQTVVNGFNFNMFYSLPSITPGCPAQTIPVFIFHHGAGSSALTFAPLALSLQEKLGGLCGTFAFDARGHGLTQPNGEISNSTKYNLDEFVSDFQQVLQAFHDEHLENISPKLQVSIILVGHSLGGSICASVLNKIHGALRTKIVGVAMLDIVEEAAIQALNTVDSFLTITPNVFADYGSAIDWHIKKGLSSLRSSAEISIPSLFYASSSGKVVRRTNLQTFRSFWDTWFKNLSSKFVSLNTSKLLILAGDDNLDRELIIGQMQGKFQLVVFQESGHFIQEDCPDKTAVTLIDFWRRNDNKTVVIKTNWTQKATSQ
ncbi:LADA_0B02124g1_1 [Lachancea dasiensis]|uniref:Protein phosphatase methylesterase 1 n=1 Tax=Lachancea dasiensis TaxID=1072105 RepID=A0A1G4IS44_9SACH|nr:LADA_0B02124g1_1 [Lachancea dasiensis]